MLAAFLAYVYFHAVFCFHLVYFHPCAQVGFHAYFHAVLIFMLEMLWAPAKSSSSMELADGHEHKHENEA